MRRVALVAAAFLAVVPAAAATDLVDRNAAQVRLAVNARGEALLTYRTGGRLKHVLAWGAINAIAPDPRRQQRRFRLDYAGGYGKYHREYWRTFRNRCRPYSGLALAWVVRACTAPDGSFWALQTWQRALPNFGIQPSFVQAQWELRLSHWSGETAVLTVKTDWAQRRYDHLYGSLFYRGRPVFGFHTTSDGQPLDRFGRLIYVDTFNSGYGRGWYRENSFVTHRPRGIFCYALHPRSRPVNPEGTQYRVTAMGPGVTPDLMWEGPSPGRYNAEADRQANAEQRASYSDRVCRPS
jgi:hypothetical protein